MTRSHPAGTVLLSVTTPGGTATSATTYRFQAAPTVTSFTPAAGPTTGGTTVTITGTNLTGTTAVTFGGSGATSYTVTSPTSIRAVAPPHAAGAVRISATTAGGTATSPSTFTFVTPPAITGFTPAAGPTAGGTTVTITGTNLTGATAVTFGATAAASFTVTSATTIKAVTRAHAAGVVAVSVTTAGGTVTSPTTFRFQGAPTITTFVPGYGTTNGGTTVTITGTNLTNATAVKFGTTTAASFTAVSSSKVVAVTKAHAAGTVKISVTTPGGTATSTASFNFRTVAAPTVTRVTPKRGPTAGGTTVTITGTNLTAATAVQFGTTTAASFTVTSATTIKAVTKSHASATVRITVTAPGGSVTSGAGVTYRFTPALGAGIVLGAATRPASEGATRPAVLAAAESPAITPLTAGHHPAISGFTPTSGPTTGGTTVTISGTYLGGVTAVRFGTVTVRAGTFHSTGTTAIHARSPAHVPGTVTITVVTNGGTRTSSGTFKYTAPAPTVASFTPATGTTTGGTTVTISGSGFMGATAVRFGTTAAASFTVTGPTTITAVTRVHAAGTVTISVTAPGGTVTSGSSYKFLVPPPSITGFTPTSGSTSGGTSVTINGAGFSGATSVKFGTTTASSFKVTSASRITAVTRAHAAGTVTISVTTPVATGTSSGTYRFAVPPPTVTSFIPTGGTTAGGTTVIVRGTNFTGASAVKFGTTPAASFAVVNATEITAVTAAHSAGGVKVSVTTPGGTATSTGNFTFSAISGTACSPVYFNADTQVYGPIFANDSIYVGTTSTPGNLGPIETADPSCIAVTGERPLSTPGTGPYDCVPAATSVTGTADRDNLPKQTIPKSDSQLATFAAETLTTGPSYGCVYYGPTTITFDKGDQMTVWSPDSATTATCLPSQGATVNVPNGGHTTKGNGVIYVKTQTTLSACKPTANPFANLATGGTGKYSQVGEYARIGATTPNCEADVFVSNHPTTPGHTKKKPTSLSGVSGPLTIGSSANIVVTGTIKYTHCGQTFTSSQAHTLTPVTKAPKYACPYHPAGTPTPTRRTRTEPNDVLGLIANDYVEVNHPITTTPSHAVATCAAGARGTPLAAVCEPGPITVDAAILALQHSFLVNHYTTSSWGSHTGEIGTLTVYGTINQKWRGAVGTGSGVTTSTGYVKYYDWDSGITGVTPPHYLDPSTPSWGLASSSIGSSPQPPCTPTAATPGTGTYKTPYRASFDNLHAYTVGRPVAAGRAGTPRRASAAESPPQPGAGHAAGTGGTLVPVSPRRAGRRDGRSVRAPAH